MIIFFTYWWKKSLYFLKLSSANYIQWAHTMKHLIHNKKLWGFVDGWKPEQQLILIKNVDEKNQELSGDENEKCMIEYEKKCEEWKIGHRKVIAWF